VLEHLSQRGLEWREDPSNADTQHLRNRVRHALLPYLELRFNPRVREALARTAALLADEAGHMATQAEALLARIATRDDLTLVLDRLALGAAPAAVARAAIRLGLQQAGGLDAVDQGHVERVLGLVRSRAPSGRRLAIPGGREASFTHQTLRIERRPKAAAKAVSSSRTKP
jgi:tRNA(Ile)-lysidine synthase